MITAIFIIILLVFLTITTAQTPQEFLDMGNAKMKSGNYEGAIKDYDMFIKMEPNNGCIYNNRGRARAGLGDFTGAVNDYEKAISESRDI